MTNPPAPPSASILSEDEWEALYENDAVDYLRADRAALRALLAECEEELEIIGHSSSVLDHNPLCLLCRVRAALGETRRG